MRLARLTTSVLALALLAAPLAAEAQQPATMPRIAFVCSTAPVTMLLGSEPSQYTMRAFLQRLRELRHVEGQNNLVDRRSAEGRFERFP